MVYVIAEQERLQNDNDKLLNKQTARHRYSPSHTLQKGSINLNNMYKSASGKATTT